MEFCQLLGKLKTRFQGPYKSPASDGPWTAAGKPDTVCPDSSNVINGPDPPILNTLNTFTHSEA